MIAWFAIRAGGFQRIDPFFQIEHGISVLSIQAYFVYFFFVALIVILSLTAGRRGFCHYVCWMAPFMVLGTLVRNRIGWPALHLESDPDKCKQCTTCNQKCPMSLNVMDMVNQKKMTNPECTLCGSCVDHCPEKAIGYAFNTHTGSATSHLFR